MYQILWLRFSYVLCFILSPFRFAFLFRARISSAVFVCVCVCRPSDETRFTVPARAQPYTPHSHPARRPWSLSTAACPVSRRLWRRCQRQQQHKPSTHTHTPLYVPLTHLSWYTTFYSHTTLTSYITHTLSVSRARALPHSPFAALLLSLSRSRRLQLIFKTNCNCTQYISVRAYVCVWLYIEQHPFIRDCVYM